MNTARHPLTQSPNAPVTGAIAGPSASARPGRSSLAGQGTSSNGSSERQGAVAGCASPRSTGRGAFWPGVRTAITESLGGIGLCLFLVATLSAAETLPDLVVDALFVEPQEQKPDCREQWTPDGRYVRHCNFHNGRGWVVTP